MKPMNETPKRQAYRKQREPISHADMILHKYCLLCNGRGKHVDGRLCQAYGNGGKETIARTLESLTPDELAEIKAARELKHALPYIGSGFGKARGKTHI